MSRESEIAALMEADALLMAILTGGVYTDEEVGVEGFRREDAFVTSTAFDADGYLKPCALVRQEAMVPLGEVRSLKAGDRFSAVRQRVLIFFYQYRGHISIDLAKDRNYKILEGVRLSDSYPIHWDFETAHYPDMGPVANSTVLVQHWVVTSIRSAE